MKRLVVFPAIILVLCLAACGTETTEEGDTDSDRSLSGSTLHTFIDDVKECTPYLGASTLDQWSDWDPDNPGSVLGKLFDPDNGLEESIYTQIQTLDNHIDMVNEFTDDWDSSGGHTIDSITATVDTSVRSVSVPYLDISYPGLKNVAVDREVTIQNGDLTLHMAFRINGTSEIIVEQYRIGSTEAGVFYTERNGNILRIWYAGVGDRKVQFMWEGDIGNGEFKVSECTDSGTNWQVMGGGSIAAQSSQMAFMTRNDATNSSEDKYYITISLGDLLDGNEETVIAAAGASLSGSDVLDYINEDDSDCLGFLNINEYPEQVSDLDWNN